jgi:hypothetical protein
MRPMLAVMMRMMVVMVRMMRRGCKSHAGKKNHRDRNSKFPGHIERDLLRK